MINPNVSEVARPPSAPPRNATAADGYRACSSIHTPDQRSRSLRTGENFRHLVSLATFTFHFVNRKVRQLIGVRLPMTAVETGDRHRLDGVGVETPHVDADAVGVGARYVEGLDAAHRAEMMLRDSGVEGVGREHILALDQAESVPRHDQMQMGCHGADRTIAELRVDGGWCLHLETHPAAVAALEAIDGREVKK